MWPSTLPIDWCAIYNCLDCNEKEREREKRKCIDFSHDFKAVQSVQSNHLYRGLNIDVGVVGDDTMVAMAVVRIVILRVGVAVVDVVVVVVVVGAGVDVVVDGWVVMGGWYGTDAFDL